MSTLLILGSVLFFAWDLFWWAAGVRPISPGRLRKMLKTPGDHPVLVDIRTFREYNAFHIKNAQSLPNPLLKPNELETEDRDRRIVVVCMSGHRSAVVAHRLRKQGFRRISYLAWGMIAWAATGGPVITRSSRKR